MVRSYQPAKGRSTLRRVPLRGPKAGVALPRAAGLLACTATMVSVLPQITGEENDRSSQRGSSLP